MTGDPQRSRFSHPVLFRLAAIALGLFMAIGAFEVASRLGFVGVNPRRGWVTVPGQRLPVRAAISWGYEATPWFGRFGDRAYSLRTELVPFSVVTCDTHVGDGGEPTCGPAQHNSSGFRMPEFTVAHPPGTFRIVIVGDSFTWGDGVELERTYHRVLQARFDREHVAQAPKVEIIALGINGSSFPDNVIRLMTFGEHLQPDLVLVQFFNNDLQYRATQDLLGDSDNDSYTSFLMETTAAGRLLKERMERMRRSDGWMVELERAYDPQSQEWSIFEAALATLDGWRSKAGVPVAFLSFPDVDTNMRGKNYNHYKAMPPTYPLVARAEQVIEEHRFPLLRVVETFREQAGDRYLAVSPSNAHYGPVGHQLAADAIHGFITHADWVSLAAVPRPAGANWEAERALRDDAASRWSEYLRSAERQHELFSRLLEQLPDDPWLIENLARIDRVEGRSESCRAGYARLFDLHPEYAAPWFQMSTCTDSPSEREPLLVRMLETVPDHPGASHELARLDENEGRPGRACGCYGRAMEIATSGQQTKAAINAAKRLQCQTAKVEPCPGRNPLWLPAPEPR